MARLLDGLEAQVIAEYQAGATIDALAARYGCSARPIRQVLINAEVSLRHVGKPVPYEEATERRMARSYELGATIDQLEAQFGGTNRTVRNALIRQGAVIRPTGRRPSG